MATICEIIIDSQVKLCKSVNFANSLDELVRGLYEMFGSDKENVDIDRVIRWFNRLVSFTYIFGFEIVAIVVIRNLRMTKL